jgi:hypothetical protein
VGLDREREPSFGVQAGFVIVGSRSLMAGVMRGGQQYLDCRKPNAPGVPTGLGIFLVEER